MEKEKPLEKPENINPELTRNFVNFIKEKSESGKYRVEVIIGDRRVPIDVFPTGFPPRSDYSVSSKSVFETELALIWLFPEFALVFFLAKDFFFLIIFFVIFYFIKIIL